MTAPRAGDWMQTYSGGRFWPLDPKPEEVAPEDIAHALSLICRYGGHATQFYSVAEHCYLLSYAVPPRHALWALLHDAAEAYVGDMVRPLKRSMPDYRAIEYGVLRTIAYRFDLSWPMPAEVIAADNRILRDERAAVMTCDHWPTDDLEPLGVTIVGWNPAVAEQAYLDRLVELTGRAES